MATASEHIRAELERWDNVTVTDHRFGGIEFRVGRREIGHLHGNRLADIPFPKAIRDGLIAAGRAQPHHVLPESGWVSRYIRATGNVEDDAEVADVIALFRLAYDRPWQTDTTHDEVDEASEDSFPASDPPAFGPVTGVGHASKG